MRSKFIGWLPNVTGNLSFSLIGGLSQPSPCELINVFHSDRRVIACSQKRNLSDNLISKSLERPGRELHRFSFTLLSRTGFHEQQDVDYLSGWILLHAGPALELDVAREQILEEHRNLVRFILPTANFAVFFRLARNGRCSFAVPEKFQVQDVEFGNNTRLYGNEALRPLVAQCFYFLRDITHRHQHHSPNSDTLTSVWSADDGVRWIRETLYELYRRVIISRRIRSPRGQEDALGIIAYIGAFEANVAGEQRKKLIRSGRPHRLIPEYNVDRLKESINASLEVKRRRRIQRNVVAAAIPAFCTAFAALSYSIYKENDIDWSASGYKLFIELLSHPISLMINIIKYNEWAYLAFFFLGVLWVLAFTGILVPANWYVARAPAQVASPLGKAFTVGLVGVLAAFVTALVSFLLLT